MFLMGHFMACETISSFSFQVGQNWLGRPMNEMSIYKMLEPDFLHIPQGFYSEFLMSIFPDLECWQHVDVPYLTYNETPRGGLSESLWTMENNAEMGPKMRFFPGAGARGPGSKMGKWDIPSNFLGPPAAGGISHKKTGWDSPLWYTWIWL